MEFWGAYGEAVKRPGSNTTTQIIELEITNLNSTPIAAGCSPEATYVQGRTLGILLGCGGGNAVAYPADMGLSFTNNGAAFRTGLTFLRNSLVKDPTTNLQHAIMMADKMRLEWYTSDAANTVGFAIHGDVDVAANAITMAVSNLGVLFNNSNGGIVGRFASATLSPSANYTLISSQAPGTNPLLQSTGGDANSSQAIRGSGTGCVVLQSGDAANKMQVNTTGIGFFNATPVAKQRVGGALNTGGTETNTNLATRINDLRAALINYGLAA